MAGLFGNRNTGVQKSQREILSSRFHSARHNLLLVIVFTLINIILLVTNSGSYFLFSAYIPYMLIGEGMYACGLFPAEYYDASYSQLQFFDTSFMIVCAVIAAVILLLFLVSWILSKKPRIGWLIFALVLFAIDTVAMILMAGDLSQYIIDILFHIWAIVSLTMGCTSYFKLKKLPVETEQDYIPEESIEQQEQIG